MSTVLIIAIVFGSIVAMQWIKMMGKEREEGAAAGIGMRELEGRIEEAVTRAIEPLQKQVGALEEIIGRQEPARQLGDGSRSEDRAVRQTENPELEEGASARHL